MSKHLFDKNKFKMRFYDSVPSPDLDNYIDSEIHRNVKELLDEVDDLYAKQSKWAESNEWFRRNLIELRKKRGIN